MSELRPATDRFLRALRRARVSLRRRWRLATDISWAYLHRRPLSTKLGLVLLMVIVGAIAIVYLAVLPQLESRLVNAKTRELRRALPTVIEAFESTSRFAYDIPATFFATSLNARVVVYERLGSRSLSPYVDSSGLSSADIERDPVARRAAETDAAASGRVRRAGREFAEVASPVGDRSVVLLSSSLADALSTVGLIRRSLLLAGLLALLVSGFLGYLAAWRFARRIRRLETAARRLAGGDFGVPILDRGGDEVGQLARAFDEMRLHLAHLDRARREFIANASHELRTPIFSLGGFLELLAHEELNDETRREFLDEARAQIQRLTRLATDMLDLSRFDSGGVHVEIRELDLTASAQTVVDEFRVRAEERRHTLRCDSSEPVLALGDEQRVLQIGRALVENALFHTSAGTEIVVRPGVAGSRATLAVEDSGEGIAPEEQEHVFERFYRGSGGVAHGSGLGLAIARELATRMHGALTLTSDPGRTAFTLELPLASHPAHPFSRENSPGAIREIR